jgi:histidinol-phosphate/aromatic aminotransferase/cobyric acid decarboxylase-like protein
LLHEVDKLRPPYNISVLNAECALFALEHADTFAEQAATIRAERDRHVLRDTTIPPRGSRTISLSVTVPAGEPSRVEALLYNSFDSDPIVRTVRAL